MSVSDLDENFNDKNCIKDDEINNINNYFDLENYVHKKMPKYVLQRIKTSDPKETQTRLVFCILYAILTNSSTNEENAGIYLRELFKEYITAYLNSDFMTLVEVYYNPLCLGINKNIKGNDFDFLNYKINDTQYSLPVRVKIDRSYYPSDYFNGVTYNIGNFVFHMKRQNNIDCVFLLEVLRSRYDDKNSYVKPHVYMKNMEWLQQYINKVNATCQQIPDITMNFECVKMNNETMF